MKFETLIIRTREVLTREIEIRVSRRVDRPEPCGPLDAIDMRPVRRVTKSKRAVLLLADRRAA